MVPDKRTEEFEFVGCVFVEALAKPIVAAELLLFSVTGCEILVLLFKGKSTSPTSRTALFVLFNEFSKLSLK